MTTTDTTTTRTPLSIPALRTSIAGRVIAPDDAEYDRARTVMYGGGPDDRPAVIVKVANVDDVVRVVALARETGLELAVRSGGHSGAGHSVVDGGIVLDLEDMKAIDIDVDGRTVWAESGLTAAELSQALDAHDLALGFGDTGSVGIGGITLGGGVGYLGRKYGLTIDDLIGAEIVTADGTFHQVDAEHEPDLFWALRGGGGNFGVVTRFHYRVHEVGQVLGGLLILPATPETVAGFIAAAEAAPEELGTIANVMPCPPMPFVPAEHHGEVVIFGILDLRRRPGRRGTSGRTVPRAGDTARRPGPPDALPGDLSARGPRLSPVRGLAKHVHRPCRWRSRDAHPRSAGGVGRIDARRAAARARWRDRPRPGRCHGIRASGQPDHGQHRGVLRRSRRQAAPRGLGDRVRRGPRPGRPRRLRQLRR